MGFISIKAKSDKDKKDPKGKKKVKDTPQSRNYSRYYDTPDGQDVPTKVMVASRYGILTGLIMSTYDVMMYSHATGLGKILYRYMVHTIPLGLMGATFAAVANGVQIARQKDDELNYFAGGMACGPIVAKYLRSGHGYVVGGLVLGVAGFIKKTAVDNGWEFFPDVPAHMGTCRSWRNDWTLSEDPKDKCVC